MGQTNVTFSRCGDDAKGRLTCSVEITLSITVAVLIIIDIIELIALGPYKKRNDFRRIFSFGNLVKLVVRIFVLAGLCLQHEEQPLQYCSAIGIFFAFLGKSEILYLYL